MMLLGLKLNALELWPKQGTGLTFVLVRSINSLVLYSLMNVFFGLLSIAMLGLVLSSNESSD